MHVDKLAVDEIVEEIESKATQDLLGKPLTPRERQVLLAIVEGKTNGRISIELSIAEKTVEAHRGRLYRKLGATNTAHAVALAFRKGLVT